VADIAELTDRQISEIYFHPRDEQGRLSSAVVELPGEDEPLTLEQERALLFGVGRSLGVPEEELQTVWRAKHGDS
jgi:hypothetical protein